MCGYSGPIYMTHPTKAICPILLEDYRKITVDKKGETGFFTSEMIKTCMRKSTAVHIHQTIKVDEELEIRAYYAGHVLGAAMFMVRVGTQSVVYTGDYNMTPDRHLGAAWIEHIKPDMLITETTYATTIRDSKRARERDFLKKVHDCVSQGGKVLIPVFALGRAQELCILIETYWERLNLDIPVYFSGGLTSKANDYYKLFISWTNQKIKSTFAKRNMFDFKYIKEFNATLMDYQGPMVLFATPGMLHSGFSLEVFKQWAPDPKNMVILPGYCVAGTVGAKVLDGQKVIDVDRFTRIHVNLQVQNLSFSAHADAKGILQLIKMCGPKNVVLVHGEKGKMAVLKNKIIKELSLPCYDPGNGSTISVHTSKDIPVDIDTRLLRFSPPTTSTSVVKGLPIMNETKRIPQSVAISGVLLMKENDPVPTIIPSSDAAKQIGVDETHLSFAMNISLNPSNVVKLFPLDFSPSVTQLQEAALQKLHELLLIKLAKEGISQELLYQKRHLSIRTLSVSLKDVDDPESDDVVFTLSWGYEDEELSSLVISLITQHLK
jgi:integrator complex subunit 11